MNINTENIVPIIVEIEGNKYPVAEKTIAIADALIKAGENAELKHEYQLWLAELDILLGKEAVEKLFCSGPDENIDRLQRIHAGVLGAFEYHAMQTEMLATERRAEAMNRLAKILCDAFGRLNAIVSNIDNKAGIPKDVSAE